MGEVLIKLNKKVYHASSKNIFWACFVMLLVIHCIENTSLIYLDVFWLKWMYQFRNLLYLVLLFKIGFLTTYNKKEFIWVAVAILVSVVGFFGSDNFTLLEFFIVMIAAKDQSPRHVVLLLGWIKGVAIIITLLFWRVGILEALYYLDDQVGVYNTYGFCHRNVLGANVAVVCLVWFYLKYGKIKKMDLLGWSVIALGTYSLAVSRTSLLVMVFIIFGFYFFQIKEEYIVNIPRMHKIIVQGFLCIFVIFFICTVLYNREIAIWKLIDGIFTKRLHYANYCFEEYGLSCFGQRLPLVSSMQQQVGEVSKLILDNSLMRAIFYYGIFPGGLFLGGYYKALDITWRKKDYALTVALIVFVIYGLSESYMLDVFYQFPLMIAYMKYFQKDNVDECELPLCYINEQMMILTGQLRKRMQR